MVVGAGLAVAVVVLDVDLQGLLVVLLGLLPLALLLAPPCPTDGRCWPGGSGRCIR